MHINESAGWEISVSTWDCLLPVGHGPYGPHMGPIRGPYGSYPIRTSQFKKLRYFQKYECTFYCKWDLSLFRSTGLENKLSCKVQLSILKSADLTLKKHVNSRYLKNILLSSRKFFGGPLKSQSSVKNEQNLKSNSSRNFETWLEILLILTELFDFRGP